MLTLLNYSASVYPLVEASELTFITVLVIIAFGYDRESALLPLLVGGISLALGGLVIASEISPKVQGIFMTNLLHGKPCILNHFPDEPSGMTRDYCYVGDVVKANARALAAGSGATFNIGTGQGTKTLELFNIIYSSMKKMRPSLSEELSRPESRQARPGDIRRSCLVIEKARRELGWEPEMDLESGIGMTLEWWMNEAGVRGS